MTSPEPAGLVETVETVETTGGSMGALEARVALPSPAPYVLTLFVAGASELSGRAIAHVRALCEEHLADRYSLRVVDVHRDPSLMSTYDVVAAPTLIKQAPLPQRTLVGDLSDTARVLAALGVVPAQRAP